MSCTVFFSPSSRSSVIFFFSYRCKIRVEVCVSVYVRLLLLVLGNREAHLPQQIFPPVMVGGVGVCGGESVHRDYGHDLCLYRAVFYTAVLPYSAPVVGTHLCLGAVL